MQRARSAANLFLKKNIKTKDYNAVGCEPVNNEIIENWLVYKVLSMDDIANTILLKVCIPKMGGSISICSKNIYENIVDRVK